MTCFGWINFYQENRVWIWSILKLHWNYIMTRLCVKTFLVSIFRFFLGSYELCFQNLCGCARFFYCFFIAILLYLLYPQCVWDHWGYSYCTLGLIYSVRVFQNLRGCARFFYCFFIAILLYLLYPQCVCDHCGYKYCTLGFFFSVRMRPLRV